MADGDALIIDSTEPGGSGSIKGELKFKWSPKESPLTFSTGLTRSVNTVTSDLSTGKAGGQSAVGGTAGAENLTLSSTSNASKGKVILGTASAYDQANDRLGLGTTSPTEKLQINTGCLAFSGTNTGPGTLSGVSGSSTIVQLWVGGDSRLIVDSNGISGSAASGGTLEINTTTHATKGFLDFGPSVTSTAGSTWRETNDRWSFGAGHNGNAGTGLTDTIELGEASNIKLGTATGTKIGTATTQKLGFFNSAPVVQQASAANLTNNVTSGGTDNTIADFTDLTIYANSAAAIRNDIYQLARKLKQVNDALRLYGLLS